MKRKESIYAQLNQLMTVEQASNALSVPSEGILPYYQGQTSISLRCLLKRISRANSSYFFPAIGEIAYTLKGVMMATEKGRSWTLLFISRNNVRSWCVGNHYYYSKSDVDGAWQREKSMWSEWITVQNASAVYGIDIREVLHAISLGKIITMDGPREQYVSRSDVKRIWKQEAE